MTIKIEQYTVCEALSSPQSFPNLFFDLLKPLITVVLVPLEVNLIATEMALGVTKDRRF